MYCYRESNIFPGIRQDIYILKVRIWAGCYHVIQKQWYGGPFG